MIDVEKVKADIIGTTLAIASGFFARHVYSDKPLNTWIFGLAILGVVVGIGTAYRPFYASLKSAVGIGGGVLSNIRGTTTTTTTLHADIEAPPERRTVLGGVKRQFMETYSQPRPKDGDA